MTLGIQLKHGYQLLRSWESYDPRTVVRFADKQQARRFLHEFTSDLSMRMRLRNLLAEHDGVSDLSLSEDHAVIDRLSALLAFGHVRVVSGETARARSTTSAAAPPPAPPKPKPAPPPPTKPKPGTFITFKVVDDVSGKPLPGVKLKVKLSNGQVGEFTTDWAGTVDIRSIPSGTCDIQIMSYEEVLEVIEVT